MASSTTFSSSNCNVQRARPAGGEPQARVLTALLSHRRIFFFWPNWDCACASRSTRNPPRQDAGQLAASAKAAPLRLAPPPRALLEASSAADGGRGKFASSQCLEK